ncbi:hypothetical protein MXB_5645 [Myxobolus squamalis]|nr:hypothetical protein MXB_5645 [Myxobolus squamalis]
MGVVIIFGGIGRGVGMIIGLGGVGCSGVVFLGGFGCGGVIISRGGVGVSIITGTVGVGPGVVVISRPGDESSLIVVEIIGGVVNIGITGVVDESEGVGGVGISLIGFLQLNFSSAHNRFQMKNNLASQSAVVNYTFLKFLLEEHKLANANFPHVLGLELIISITSEDDMSRFGVINTLLRASPNDEWKSHNTVALSEYAIKAVFDVTICLSLFLLFINLLIMSPTAVFNNEYSESVGVESSTIINSLALQLSTSSNSGTIGLGGVVIIWGGVVTISVGAFGVVTISTGAFGGVTIPVGAFGVVFDASCESKSHSTVACSEYAITAVLDVIICLSTFLRFMNLLIMSPTASESVGVESSIIINSLALQLSTSSNSGTSLRGRVVNICGGRGISSIGATLS